MPSHPQLKRIALEGIHEKHHQIRIDLIFDGLRAKRGIEYFGLWHDTRDQSRYPFTLSTEGEIDFGTGLEGADRYYTCNLLSREIRIDEQITLARGTEQTVYHVISITPLI